MMDGTVREHKFKVGQSFNFTSGPFGRGGTNRIHKVTQLLPPEGDDYHCRIKNVDETARAGRQGKRLDRIA
jgi:hypothetical protein